MLTPDQFRINEAWIVSRANELPLFVKEVPYDCYFLMDAGSCYVLGYVLASKHGAPDEREVAALLEKAWRGKKQWAQKLIVTGDEATDNVFRDQAEARGLQVEVVPEEEMPAIVGPIRRSFEEMFLNRGT